MQNSDARLLWLVSLAAALGCSSEAADARVGENEVVDASDGVSTARCGRGDISPVCEDRSTGLRGRPSVCSSIFEPGSITASGVVVGRGTGTAPCAAGFGVDCAEPSYIEVETATETVTFGFCVPGGYEPPPFGTIVSVSARIDDGIYCPASRSVVLRDGSGQLLLSLVDGERLRATSDFDEFEKTLLCHRDTDGRSRERFALSLRLGDETVVVGDLEEKTIGPYVVKNLGIVRDYDCPEGPWDDCHSDGVQELAAVVIARLPD